MGTTSAMGIRMRWPVRGLAALITAYQRYVSPYKGFQCAHRVAHGGASCSAYAKRVLLRRGIFEAARRMRARFAACAAAAVMLHASAAHADDERRKRDQTRDTDDCVHCCSCMPDPVTPLLVQGGDAACQAAGAVISDAASCAAAGACLPF